MNGTFDFLKLALKESLLLNRIFALGIELGLVILRSLKRVIKKEHDGFNE